MASIKFNKKIFEKEIGKLTDEMQNKIALFGMTVASLDENGIELDITPDRPDLLSYQGFKISFLNFIGKKKGIKKYVINKPEKNYKVLVESSVKDVRPYTSCAIIKNVNLDDERIKELIDLQEKLHTTVGRKRKKLAIGIYPLDKIRLPITYKALEPDKIKFKPLEANREMSGLEILQRHPVGKKYSSLLAGKQKFPIFIDANKEILSMPPIINSELTGRVDKKTKNLFIECSGFEKNILDRCLNIITMTLGEMGGKIYSMKVGSAITPEFKTEKKKISLENTNKLLGLELNEKQLKELLEKMGHNYSKKEVEIAPWRVDILHEVDLIEDVAIAYGYDKFIPEIPSISTIGEEDPKESIKRKISSILSGLNMLEISNYHLTTKKDQFTKMGISEKQETGFVDIEESKTEYNILRRDLSHYMLKIMSENVDSEYPQRLYEIGKTFVKEDSIEEKEKLCLATIPGNFTETKQITLYLSKMLGIKLEFKEPEKTPSHLIDGRTAEILIDDKSIGFVGEIHPKILKNWKIKMPIGILEVDLEEIYKKLI